MTIAEVARVLEETVRAYNQFDSLALHYAGIIMDDPYNSFVEDWDECYDVAHNNNLDWKTIVELVLYWSLEERMRLGAYETK